jgi:hypothetical protein
MEVAMSIENGLDVIKVAESRGFAVLLDLGPPPMPFLRGGPKDEATDALREALRAFRLEIIEELTKRNAIATIKPPAVEADKP